jgi:cytochrome b561
MTLRNTSTAYGSMAKWLHWSIAALFLVEYCVIYFRHWFTTDGTPVNLTALQLHLAIGITVGAVVVLRIVWRLNEINPAPPPGTRWEHLGARLTHWALYFFMVAMPLSGYLYSKNPTDFFGLFTVPPFGDTALGQWLVVDRGLSLLHDIREPMRVFHRDFAGIWVLWILVAVHAAAALYHHYVRRDNTLVRMLPGAPSLRDSMRAPSRSASA